MGVFRQLGDPVCPDCLCQHHGAAYAEVVPPGGDTQQWIRYVTIAENAEIIQSTIVITERCCVAVNSALLVLAETEPFMIEIERPIGTIRTTQEDAAESLSLALLHHAAWEVLDPGTYTYHAMNRFVPDLQVFAAWLKIIASDCEG